MPDTRRLNLQAITANDPLAAWLRSYLHPLLFAAGGLALGVLYTLVLPQITGTLLASLADWPTLVVMLVLVPIILGWYAWQPAAVLSLYQGLLARVSDSADARARAAAALADEHQAPIWTWLALVLTLLFTAVLAARLWPPDGSALTLTAGIGWYCPDHCYLTIYTAMFIVRQMMLTLGLSRLFQLAVVNSARCTGGRARIGYG
jgi:hypothetical protein